MFHLQFSADILACNVDDNNIIEVLDTWNNAATERANSVDTTNDTSILASSFEDGRITCE